MTRQLSDVMLEINNTGLRYDQNGEWHWPASGSVIKRINLATAQWLLQLFKATQVKHPEIPLSFLLAIPAVESKYSPDAVNKNLDKSNVGEKWGVGGYDVGICQMKVRYHTPHNMTPEQGEQLLFDPARAIPYYGQYLSNLLHLVRHTKWAPGADPRCKNEWWCVATLYKSGPGDGITQINENRAPDYGATIAHWESVLAAAQGVPSVMADVLPAS